MGKDKMDIFDSFEDKSESLTHPLAERMRPQNLDELVGQENLTGKGSLLQQAIENI